MKLARKIMSIILTVMLVLSCIPMSAISASALADLGVTIDTGAWVTLKDTNSDGYYEIGNADELYAFSAIVNGGNNSINGILTNNIVINTNLISSSGGLNSGNFRRWTPIGTYSRPYAGHFKGNNKTISGLYSDNDYESGLFGYLNNTVENVGVIDSYIRGIENIGAIAGYNAGTIKNCYKTGTVHGDDTIGGITGYNSGTVQNCYNSGTVGSGSSVNCRFIVGNNNGTITNCYYDISRSGELSGTTYKTSSQFASGEVAYLLGDAFGQTIGTDKLPVLGGNKVYRNVNCKGEFVEYSNTNEVSHIFDNGFCTNGDSYQPAIDSNNDGYYEIDNAGKLYWFEQQVNSGNTSINAILTADITVNEGTITAESTDARVWTPIGNDSNKKYNGIFDGNNKTVSGLYFSNKSVDNVGLFGYIGENSEIKNVGVVNSYFYGCFLVGGVVGYNNSGTVTNCYNTGTVSGYRDVGGVVGSGYGTVTNCYNTGTVSGNIEVGGVVGWNSGTLTNCYNAGSVRGNYQVGGVVGYNHSGTLTNCYYLDTTCKGGSDGIDVAGSAEPKTAEQFANGAVACLLGEAFGQTLGTDELPVLGGTKVYPIRNCNNDIVKGSNSNTNETIGHVYETVKGYDSTCAEEGRTDEVKCSVCGDIKTPATVISAQGHNYVTTEGYDATCTEDGLTDEVKCSVCGDIKTPQEVIPSKGGHNFDNGFCAVCGTYQPAIDSNEDGYFEIDNAGKLYWFAQQVNSGNTAINAILTADITVNEGEMDSILDDVKAWVSIGNLDNKYSGVFDGNNKTISGLHYLEENRQIGLFGCTGSDAEIKNVGVTNTYFNAYSNVGAICGLNNGKITNCYSDAFIGGYRYVGGIAGNNSGTIENCCFIGDVGAVISLIGGVSGFNSGVINNCYSTADIYPCDSDFGSVLGSNEGTITNCYYLTNGNVGGINGSDVAGSAEAKTAEQFASGEVAYLLGEAFGQTIGTEERPVLGGKTVYQIKNCKNEFVKYSNTNETIGHKFDNGFCTVCGNYQPAVDSDNDSYYEIDNAGKLYWFAQQVNLGNTAINAILTADIVVNEGEITENSTDSREWTPIGNKNNQYNGIFDGNNKTVSGLYT